MSSPSGGETESYFAPAGPQRGEIRERASRFLALVVPVSDEDEIATELQRLRREYRDASHICWAWRLGAPARERSADAGEPSGTAGLPILQVLRGERISDVLLAVVRWFGGTKLGKGGLARAYAAAARTALESAPRVERIVTSTFELSLPYPRLGAMKRLLDDPACRLLTESYGETVRLTVSVAQSGAERFEAAVAELGPAVSCAKSETEAG